MEQPDNIMKRTGGILKNITAIEESEFIETEITGNVIAKV